MPTTTPKPTVTLGGRLERTMPVEVREVPLNLADVPDISTGMKTFSPRTALIQYRRRYLGGGVWGPWTTTVRLAGPRRLNSGELSARTRVEVTYRADAKPSGPLAPPEYLRRHVNTWHPLTTDTKENDR